MTTYNHEEVKQKVLLQLQYEDMGPTRLFNFVHEMLKDETEAKKLSVIGYSRMAKKELIKSIHDVRAIATVKTD